MRTREQQDVVMEDLLNNPKAYGLPTFQEFCKDPDRWRKSADKVLGAVDIGSVGGLKKFVAEQTYEVAGYKCKTLEECQRVAQNEGLSIESMEMKPEVYKLGGDKYGILVSFIKKQLSTERLVEEAVKNLVSTEGSKSE